VSGGAITSAEVCFFEINQDQFWLQKNYIQHLDIKLLLQALASFLGSWCRLLPITFGRVALLYKQEPPCVQAGRSSRLWSSYRRINFVLIRAQLRKTSTTSFWSVQIFDHRHNYETLVAYMWL
jgi:hypothetical protein